MTDFQVGPGMLAAIEYEVFDADGELAGRSDPGQPLLAVIGYGQLLPALERALDGLPAGGQRSVTLRPEQAYGRRDPAGTLEVDRDDFPDDVAAGDRFEVEAEGGERLVLRVLDVSKDAVVVDANHPLAGQRVRFELRVLNVRPATEQELERAAAQLEAAERPGTEFGPAPGGPVDLVAPERLIRRRRRLNAGA
jgi:FKBP-type peptidyl-prolyl cis-trans isomerase SlyD